MTNDQETTIDLDYLRVRIVEVLEGECNHEWETSPLLGEGWVRCSRCMEAREQPREPMNASADA